MITLDIDRCNATQRLQISIGDESGGYRVAGPKYTGNSTHLRTVKIDERTAKEMIRYLKQALPKEEG